MKRYLCIAAALFGLILIPVASASRLIIQSGHQGKVNSIQIHPRTGVLVSAGDDGTVKIWQTETGLLLNTIRISHLPVQKVVLHPVDTRLTALVKTSLSSSRLISFDWIDNTRLFDLELNEVPLFLTYSARGSYFIYSRAEWDSLVVCNPVSGRRMTLLNKGFGIVSFCTTSSSEKKIMLYQPLGKIVYKEMDTGKDILAKPLTTLPDLKAVSISSNSRYIAAAKDKELVVVDLTTGKMAATASRAGILATLVDPDGLDIFCLVKEKNGNRLYKYAFNGNELHEIETQDKSVYNITDFIYRENRLYYTDAGGKILYTGGDNQGIISLGSNLLPISGVAVSSSILALGTEKKVIVIDMSLLKSQNPSRGKYYIFDNNMSVPVGLEFYKPNKLLVWSKGGAPYQFCIQDLNSGEIVDTYAEYTSPLIKLEIIKTGILSLEQSGTAQIITKRDFEHKFQYTVTGLHRIASVSDEIMIAARSKIGEMGSSLLQINPETGETVPISVSSILCYDLVHDPVRDRLYTLCVSKEGDKTTTSLNMHYSKGYEKELSLASYAGEDLTASMVIDESGRYLYTTLGYNKISVYNSYNVRTLVESNALPRQLFLSGKLLFSINRDGSLSVWNSYLGTKFLDLYLLDTGETDWIAIAGNGRCYASERGWDYLVEFRQ